MNRIQSADFKLFVNKQLTGHDPEAELLITDQLCNNAEGIVINNS